MICTSVVVSVILFVGVSQGRHTHTRIYLSSALHVRDMTYVQEKLGQKSSKPTIRTWNPKAQRISGPKASFQQKQSIMLEFHICRSVNQLSGLTIASLLKKQDFRPIWTHAS
jgi:hypothetical protein